MKHLIRNLSIGLPEPRFIFFIWMVFSRPIRIILHINSRKSNNILMLANLLLHYIFLTKTIVRCSGAWMPVFEEKWRNISVILCKSACSIRLNRFSEFYSCKNSRLSCNKIISAVKNGRWTRLLICNSFERLMVNKIQNVSLLFFFSLPFKWQS